MPLVEWDDSYLVGIEEIDGHHRHLVELLNSVYDNFTAGASRDTLGSVLDELIDYATYHFTAEEQQMKAAAYPAFDDHSREHNHFSKRITEIQNDFHAGREALTLEVLVFLVNWLTQHILRSDAAYARSLTAANGASISL